VVQDHDESIGKEEYVKIKDEEKDARTQEDE
jgi:hypothetical protein